MKVRAQDDMHFKKSFTLHTQDRRRASHTFASNTSEMIIFFHFDLHFIHSKQVLLRSNKHSSIFSWLLDQKRVSLKINSSNDFLFIS